MIKQISIGLFLTISFASLALAQDAKTPKFNFPTQDGYVTDAANIIDDAVETELETTLRNFEGETSTEIAVVTVPSLNDFTVEEYTYELGTAWGVGKKNVDNGIVFLVAPNEHKTRIEVGYGLEGAIPDITGWGILNKTALPAFKIDDYSRGIKASVNDIIRASKDENFANEIAGTQSDTSPQNAIAVITMLVFLFLFLSWGISILGRSKSWWAGGLFGVVGGIIITILIPVAWYAIIILGLIGLGLDYLVSKNYQKAGKTAWWAGGGFNSGGGSMGGGGGHSFGGGSFGGGGASGSW